MASIAAGIAPRKIMEVLLSVKPVTMNSPRPPAPINAASVAVQKGYFFYTSKVTLSLKTAPLF
jgi:hypothetical protein